MANGWGIFNLAGAEVFDVDSVVDLTFSNKAQVSDFPVEQGAFASYNKVNVPNAIKVRLAVGGKARMGAFQAALKVAVGAADLYHVVTPTAVYLNVTLEEYGFTQSAESGLNLLVVDLSLKEIREVTPAYTTVALPKLTWKNCRQPTSASKVVGGKMQAQEPAAPPPLTYQNLMYKAEND